MTSNPLTVLQQLGQSPWLDAVHRGLLRSGELARMVRDGEITGLTANPTLFAHALAHERDYDDALAALVAAGRTAEAIVDALLVEDVQAAADALLPVHQATKRADGYVSIDLAPALARDAQATVREAKRLWRAVNRPNLMVKIPATVECLPAIEEAIASGINVNVTLVFSLARYDAVMEAYLRGLIRRLETGMRVDRIASVASFLPSRLDAAVDRLLDARIAEAPQVETRAQLERLKGKAAIAQAKLAYTAFREKFGPERFALLAREDAHPQRPLWASACAGNAAYPDVYYVEGLIGADTVNAMSPQTLAAYKEHGHPEDRLALALERAHGVLGQLAHAGIHLDEVTARLEREGLAALEHSHRALLATAAHRREALRVMARTELRSGPSERTAAATLRAVAAADVLPRLWKRDASLWPGTAPVPASADADRLAWLDADGMAPSPDALRAFAESARREGLTHAVVCGAGGATLVPELLRRSLGVARGFLDVAICDATDPAALAAIAKRAAPERTLVVLSSPSGDPAGLDALFRFWWEHIARVVGTRVGRHFVALAPPDSRLDALARERDFREVFATVPGVDGAWAALSAVGIVPAALMGHDLPKLLDRARKMAAACGPDAHALHNPGAQLGATLAALARGGRDKVTVLAPDKIAGFADWLEQLLGGLAPRQGHGLVAVTREPSGPPAVYGKDRVFVHLRLGAKPDRTAAALERAGHPVIALRLADAYDLAGEMVRWQVATAVAAHLLGTDPFTAPATSTPAPPAAEPSASEPAGAQLAASLAPTQADFATRLASQLAAARGRRWVALAAWVAPTPRREKLLQDVRGAIRKRFGVATTLDFGPRALDASATWQGSGPASAIVLQLTAETTQDVPIPGLPYGFGALQDALAAQTRATLTAERRPFVAVHLGRNVEASLTAVLAALQRRPVKPAVRANTVSAKRKTTIGRTRAAGRR
jgi:transaldolase / glucose-6-phosphate isomerase